MSGGYILLCFIFDNLVVFSYAERTSKGWFKEGVPESRSRRFHHELSLSRRQATLGVNASAVEGDEAQGGTMMTCVEGECFTPAECLYRSRL